MIFEDRVRAIEVLGFTARQARFLVIVALQSGYCLRRQYAAFAGVSYGKNVRDFLDSLVSRQLAVRFTLRADRGHLYHLHARAMYRVLRQEDNRNRREASAALIARKLMLLDYVLAHADIEWAATEDEKVELFVDRFGVSRGDLPQRVFAAAQPGCEPTTRYFTSKLPIAIAGDPPVVHFVSLVTDANGGDLQRFLEEHATLLRRLPAWTVIAVGTAPVLALADCEGLFARFLNSPLSGLTAGSEELRWYFRARTAVDRGELASLAVTDIDRFRTLRGRFSAPAFETLYRDWTAGGDDVLVARDVSASRGVVPRMGRLITEVLPFDYTQFGSLPGVA
jgi:hypothetical protein